MRLIWILLCLSAFCAYGNTNYIYYNYSTTFIMNASLKNKVHLTPQLLARLPKWKKAGWKAGETVDLSAFNIDGNEFTKRVLTDDGYASFYNNHPIHHP